MEANRFDTIAAAVGMKRSRRGVLQTLASAAPGGLLARFGSDGARAQSTCLANARRCGGERGPCCSGSCVRKRGSRKKYCKAAAGQGTCTVEQDACVDRTNTCNGSLSCYCSITTRGRSFCRYGPGSLCITCTQDAECEGRTGPGSRCVRCPNCFGLDTACGPPCPTQV